MVTTGCQSLTRVRIFQIIKSSLYLTLEGFNVGSKSWVTKDSQ